MKRILLLLSGFVIALSHSSTASAYNFIEEELYDSGAKIFMHWKEDWIRHSKQGSDGNPLYYPRCYVYSGNLPENVWDLAKEMSQIDDPAAVINTESDMLEEPLMTITDKFQIWQSDFTAEELAGAENVCFLIMGEDDTPKIYASQPGSEDLTRFIYSTATINGESMAVRSFMSYDDFKQLDAAGRPFVYLIGTPNGGIKGLDWDFLKTKSFAAESGNFYIPVEGFSGNGFQFRMSWVSPSDAIERNGVTDEAAINDVNRQRATFDLGVFGIDENFDYPVNYKKPECKPVAVGEENSVFFRAKETVRCLNYNVYNWYIVKEHINLGGACFMAVDPGSNSRSITLITYDPNPSVAITASEFGTMTFAPDEALMMNNSNAVGLQGATDNGIVYIDRVNYCSGDVAITKSDAHLSQWFDQTYSIYMNGEKVFESENPDGVLHIDYLPILSAGTVGISARYLCHATGLTFHSKLGTGTFSIEGADFPSPETADCNAVRVIDPGSADGRFTRDNIGVLVRGIPFKVNGVDEYACYADFSFDRGESSEILHDNHRLVTDFDDFDYDILPGWTPLDNEMNYDFVNKVNDWSTNFSGSGSSVSLYLSNTGRDIQQVSGMLHAVYPFFYQKKPTISPTASAEAPRNTGRAFAEGTDLMQYAITNVVRSVPLNIEVSGDIVSSVRNVESDEAVASSDAEYFTLSGVRVNGNPAPGLYLRRSGDTVSKVVIK